MIDELAILWECEEVATNIAIADGEKLIAHSGVATEGIGIEAVELLVTISIDVSSSNSERIAFRRVDDRVVAPMTPKVELKSAVPVVAC